MHKTLTANKISFLFWPSAFLHYDCFHGADTLLTSRHAQEGLSKPFKAFQRLSYYPAILLLTKFLKVTISRLKCKFSLHFLGKIDCFVQNLFCPYSYLPVSWIVKFWLVSGSCDASVFAQLTLPKVSSDLSWGELLYKRLRTFERVIFSLPVEPTRCSDSLLWK